VRARTKRRPSLYEQLESLPEGLTGEILDGQPRPAARHIGAASRLDRIIARHFDAISINLDHLWGPRP
jgi:hypothetical protein